MTGLEVFLMLGVLALVLGGLWGYGWLCANDDLNRYRCWVEEREHILNELERPSQPHSR